MPHLHFPLKLTSIGTDSTSHPDEQKIFQRLWARRRPESEGQHASVEKLTRSSDWH